MRVVPGCIPAVQYPETVGVPYNTARERRDKVRRLVPEIIDDSQVRQAPVGDSDFPALVRVELIAIHAMIDNRRGSAAPGMVSAHIGDLLARIADALDRDDD